MKRLSVLSIYMLVLPAALMAQSPEGSHVMRPPIEVISTSASGPIGILPAQVKAAYGFNQIPNQGQGMTIALVDAYDDPNIESDLAFYASYFHLTSCNFTKVKVGSPRLALTGPWKNP
jgi:subtilase family serine protease